ncbi:pimeloyl-ACP methyl ester carboxylesterase [Scopulibacillus darangshiensis]|uniref:Pimeloyl-ACP methyl ester carboxylesterase n=1 Tax=Scopulibacillus darangshiensis TaxID=442528 RepID=A0A4R2NE56_9BACL|nr:alpha/beta hydrolase [Scopulibacillus darangshiensis]TCP19497.1 pimeloyl-ACP methyl ester carboxylesterase [Scopulibacillus darangshiensis]
MNETLLTLRDSRRLSYAVYGDPNGVPVLLFHGTPGSRFDGKLVDEERLRGIRLVVPERPGYGLSDSKDNRLLMDCIKDVAHLAEHLELDNFFVIGISGGSPYALACAEKMADQVIGVAVICGLGPLDYPGAMEGFSQEDQMVMKGDESALLKKKRIIEAIHAQPEAILESLDKHTEFDSLLITPRLSKVFLYSMKEATRSSEGIISDSLIQAKPWNVSFEQITSPVYFWHGDHDKLVNIRHAKHLSKKIPNTQLNIIEGAGHFGATITGLNSALDHFKNRSD